MALRSMPVPLIKLLPIKRKLIGFMCGLGVSALAIVIVIFTVMAHNTVYGAPKGVFISKYFSVTNLSTIADNENSTNIIGIVKNIGNKTLNAGCNARMLVELYDSKNKLMNVIENTPPGISSLEPNGLSPFKVWTNTPTFDHYVVRMVGAIG
jgi:hypothetical protein